MRIRTLSAWMSALAITVTLGAPLRVMAGIQLVYGPMEDVSLRVALIEQRIGERLRDHLRAFSPGASFRLTITDCGVPNAFYFSGVAIDEIRVCGELLRHLVRQQLEAAAGGRGAGGAALWVAGHELGHYLIRRHRVPLLGREEDAADQVGFAVIMRSSIPADSLEGAMRFFNRPPDAQDPGQAHSLDETRRVNLACWAYGTSPKTFDTFAGQIPASRRPRCRDEAAQLWRAIRQLQLTTNKRRTR